MMTNVIQKKRAAAKLQLVAEGARNGAVRGGSTINKDNTREESERARMGRRKILKRCG